MSPNNNKKCIVASCRTMALRIFLIAKILKIKVLTITTSSDHVFSVCFSFKILFIFVGGGQIITLWGFDSSCMELINFVVLIK